MANKQVNNATGRRIARTEAYALQVKRMYMQAVDDVLLLQKELPELQQGEMFSFDSLPLSKREKLNTTLRRLHSVTLLATQKGIAVEWSEAYNDADTFIKNVYSKKVLDSKKLAGWDSRNTEAQEAFVNRSDKGMNLSDRVWQPVKRLRDELEVAITVAVGDGTSANAMSREVRKYLNDPDLMFRKFRYKDKDGNWQSQWKKRVRFPDGSIKFVNCDKDSYKVGRGVYKSSYKNAMRLTRTETNMAYRTADHDRWQSLDFVLGQRIHLSKSHPEPDICDELAGDYPKDFVFKGWHPQCFCYVTPILVDEEEQRKELRAAMRGEKYVAKGEPVRDVPQGFKDWVVANAGKLVKMIEKGTEPYFVRDNERVIGRLVNGEEISPLTTIEKAKSAVENENVSKEIERTSPNAEERKKYLSEMQSLLDTKIVINGNGHSMNVGFSKYGNKHLYSDTYGRCKVLQKDDLKDVNKLLQKAEFVKKVGLSKERKENIKRFYYYKVELRGQIIYLNVAETDYYVKGKGFNHERFLYSITDKIK